MIHKFNKGMTYIELIIVLTIFGIMSSIVVFNYGDFSDRINLSNSVNNLALQIIEAQKFTLAGKIPDRFILNPGDKTSYGVYFDLSAQGDNKSFVYFFDKDDIITKTKNKLYDAGNATNCDGDIDIDDECLEKVNLGDNNFVKDIQTCAPNANGNDVCSTLVNKNLYIIFTRPNFKAELYSYDSNKVNLIDINTVSHVIISLASPKDSTSNIKVYTSGRIQTK